MWGKYTLSTIWWKSTLIMLTPPPPPVYESIPKRITSPQKANQIKIQKRWITRQDQIYCTENSVTQHMIINKESINRYIQCLINVHARAMVMGTAHIVTTALKQIITVSLTSAWVTGETYGKIIHSKFTHVLVHSLTKVSLLTNKVNLKRLYYFGFTQAMFR